MAAQVAHGGLGTFAHRVAQEAGQRQHALAGHAGRLDEEDFAARGCPGQTGRNSGDSGAVGQFTEETRGAEQFGDIVGFDRGRSAFRWPSATTAGRLPAQIEGDSRVRGCSRPASRV